MAVGGRAEPFVLEAGCTRRDDAVLPFLLCAGDSDGALSVCEFTLGGWDAGPALHVHAATDEALYVLSGALELSIAGQRRRAGAGDFVWMPRARPHAFANAGADPVRVLVIASPGGLEDMFADHLAHTRADGGTPDPAVLAEISGRHGATVLGPPIRARAAPPL